MLFVRTAIVEFASKLVIKFPLGAAVDFGPIKTQFQELPADASGAGLARKSTLIFYSLAPMSTESMVGLSLSIDENVRRACEIQIEAIANAIAISNQCGRRVLSAFPFYYVIPESDVERKSLQQVSLYPHTVAVDTLLVPPPELPLLQSLDALKDRVDGAALLVEALANTNALGRYRELLRVFELAFGRDTYGLGRKLVQFLDPELGFSRAEIDGWLKWRDAAAHADLAKSPTIAFERDVAPFVERMQQAAIDVLMNKKVWSDFSRSRREVYRPTSAKVSARGDLRMTEGTSVDIDIRFPLDCFGAWPVRQTGVFKPIPGWWMPGSGIAE
jgi:hypothetical protein